MKDNRFSDENIILYIFGLVLSVWRGLLIAPYVQGGLPAIITGLPTAMENPFHITLCRDSVKTVLVFVTAYGLTLGIYLSDEKNYRRRQEHGSARWGNPKAVNSKYAEKDATVNKILTQNVSVSYNSRNHRRNLNTIIVGGSGAGKTRFFAKPNIMNANSSFIITDPKGELLRATGHLLEAKGYVIKVIDLIHMDKSHCYNPFAYIRDDNDVQKLVTNLFANTTPKDSKSSDPFWDKSAMMLLMALILYLYHEAPKEEQNFAMVMDMIRAGEIKEDFPDYQSPLDELFDRLEKREPDHIAVKYYKDYRGGSGKTLKSIQITLVSHLDKFNLESLAGITRTDEMELELLGTRKQAIYAITPDSDRSFNFIMGMLYTQAIQQLYDRADFKYGGRLPVHVELEMDEFANVALPEDFESSLSTMRSREISVSIILQNLAQLKTLFEKQWESIVGNCDEFLYLGGNEQSTHEYISKLLGKETIDTNTYGKSSGKSGSYQTNYQTAGRELMTPDEVRMLDNSDALLFIRGERPIMDKKYDILRHPDIALTEDGGAPAYIHGKDKLSIASVSFDRAFADNTKKDEDITSSENRYILLSEEELEERFNL